MQGEGAACVDAVVEHQVWSGIADNEVTRFAGGPWYAETASWCADCPPEFSDQSHSA